MESKELRISSASFRFNSIFPKFLVFFIEFNVLFCKISSFFIERCVGLSVCLFVCLSVGTPSFPVEILKFNAFKSLKSNLCVGKCVGLLEYRLLFF